MLYQKTSCRQRILLHGQFQLQLQHTIATTVLLLLPPQQGQSSAGSALAALGVLSGGLGGAASVKTPEELYVSFLKSDSVTDSVIERFKLASRYGAETVSDARAALAKRVVVSANASQG